MRPKQHAKQVYRWSNGGKYFGQARRQGRKWLAEIRETESGNLVRFAGIWSNMQDAGEEVVHILRHM